ncbi:MAG TPA: hypothetical protein DCQ68_21830 [Chryseobacterium indologenes]|nr:hypothetical protein [Chryseobacterium indologenes]
MAIMIKMIKAITSTLRALPLPEGAVVATGLNFPCTASIMADVPPLIPAYQSPFLKFGVTI